MPLHLLLAAISLTPPLDPTGVPTLLREPDYFVEDAGGLWRVRKPRLWVLQHASSPPPEPWTIFEDQRRAAAEGRRNALPRLRLNRPLVAFNPLTQRRTILEDWTGQSDAREIETEVHALLGRFAPPAPSALSATPVYMARLNGASGHTAEEPDDPRRFVIYLDPFRATGRLHAASTLVHELSHVGRYRARGFHANRAAPIFPKADFILLGAADELAAYQAEANFIRSALKGVPAEKLRQAVRNAMPSAELRWPPALVLLLGFGRPPGAPSNTPDRIDEVRRQIVLDLLAAAVRYWDLHHNDPLPPALQAAIRRWYLRSPEWSAIAAQRTDWLAAGARVHRPPPPAASR